MVPVLTFCSYCLNEQLDENCMTKRLATNPVESNHQGLYFEMPAEYVDLVLL